MIMSTTPQQTESVVIPKALIERRRYRSSQLIWLIPIIAAIIGISLAVKSYMDRGPIITITFKNGEGIEAGKTKIKYKEKIVERWHQPKTVVQERQTFLIVGGGTTVIERETPAPPVQLGTPGRAHGHDFTVTAGSQSGYISLPSRIDIRQSQTQNQHQHQGGHHRKPPTPGNPGQPTGPDEPPNYPIPGDPGGPVTGPGDNPVQVPFN